MSDIHETSTSDDTKLRRREKLEAWKSNLQMTLPSAPKKQSISFSLLSSKKPLEKSLQPKFSTLDYSAAEAQISKPKDDSTGGESGVVLADIESNVVEVSSKLPDVAHVSSMTSSVGTEVPDSVSGSESTAICAMDVDGDEVDPFDAFMAGIDDEVAQLKQESVSKALAESSRVSGVVPSSSPSVSSSQLVPKDSGDSVDVEDGEPVVEDEGEAVDDIQRLTQVNSRKQLDLVDHSKVSYESFRKDFYIEVPELSKMTEQEVSEIRRALDGVRIRGRDCPAPIRSFVQSGLSGKLLEKLKRMKYERPTPIQAQALPAVMKGRDVIGIAKTGSGKTLAFLLPLMRHILAQRDLAPGEGPIGLIMVPTRELATQIDSDIREFKSATGIISCCIYGGADMGAQIADLKRGAHIVVCTPGRMIEMLAMNKGRVTNLRRVTFLVIDEADRMFDLGFEQQIMRIVNNVRPDRQTVMFSATFPRQVEAAARKILSQPLEITVYGRSVVSDTITQRVEVIEHSQKFFRLMELISEWYSKGSILVFAETQNAVDTLFHNVVKSGYDALSFHSGRDQMDRDETIESFKEGRLKILIATSGASRGLDVPGLNLVVNYDVPNHLEDYIHRVGRTGRAGAKGTAITFIAPDEEQYAGDILKALKQSGSKDIPEQLVKMATAFEEKQKKGLARRHASGFVGKGYQFSEEEDKQRKAAMNSVKLHFGGDAAEEVLLATSTTATASSGARGEDRSDDEEESIEEEIHRHTTTTTTTTSTSTAHPSSSSSSSSSSSATAAAATSIGSTTSSLAAAAAQLGPFVSDEELAKMLPQQRAAAEKFNEILLNKARQLQEQQAFHAQQQQQPSRAGGSASSSSIIARSGTPTSTAGAPATKVEEQHFDDEIEINDFPQQVRRKVTSKETFADLVELTGVAITPKGIYVVPGKPVPAGERKLYLSIEGPSQEAVTHARNGIRAVLEASMDSFALRGDRPTGRYVVD